MLQNKEISNESARERLRVRRAAHNPGRRASRPFPASRIVPRGQTDVVILFFFFVILTDKTDAGRRDRERLFITMLYLPISQNASVRERNLTNFHFWYKLSPPSWEDRVRKPNGASKSEFLPFARAARRYIKIFFLRRDDDEASVELF